MIDTTLVLKNAIFDHKVITQAVDKASRKATQQGLEAVKQEMLSRLQSGDGPSRPGQSPNVHTNDATRSLRNIETAWDGRTKSGVVGSVLLRGGDGEPLPGFLERGGTRVVTQKIRGRKVKRRVRIAARPYAGPSLDDAIDSGEVVSPWSNVVSG